MQNFQALGRWLPLVLLVGCCGCAGGPRNFRKINSNTPLVRARAVSLGDDQPNSQVVPALVKRLDDSDPVVRLAASEELRRRTGYDFGYVPWDEPQNRQTAISRWRAWVKAGMPRPSRGSSPAPSEQMTARPATAASRPESDATPSNGPVASY